MGARVTHPYTEIVDGTGKKMYAAQTETVTASDLKVGDRVLAFGLEVKVAFIGNVSLELEANGKRIANGLWVPLEGSIFERIILPKRYKRTEVLEYRVPKEGERFRWKPQGHASFQIDYFKDGQESDLAYVITSVEVEEIL